LTDKSEENEKEPVGESRVREQDRLVYVLPDNLVAGQSNDEINLGELWSIVWQGKWIIVCIGALFAAVSVSYALLATEWYRAEVLLAPAEERSTQGISSQFGSLASLAGISIGGRGTAEPIAVLRSREFARDFIQDLDLMPVLFAEEWDVEAQRWKTEDAKEKPDIRDGVRILREDLIRVDQDSQTGLVILTVEWTDPDVAALWTSLLVARLNDRMRRQALEEAETNVAYLQSELSDVSVVAIQQSIGRLLEAELQKLMLARGSEEFSFRVIDSAIPPKKRSRPNRVLIVVLGTIFGGVLGIFTAVFSSAGRRQGTAVRVANSH